MLSTTARAKERARKREDMKARASGVEDSTPRAQDAAKAAAAAAAAAPSGELLPRLACISRQAAGLEFSRAVAFQASGVEWAGSQVGP